LVRGHIRQSLESVGLTKESIMIEHPNVTLCRKGYEAVAMKDLKTIIYTRSCG
jgi:hypothetical protein